MEPVQPNASVAATGLGVRYVGQEYTYAYSGGVDATDSTTPQTMLKYTSSAKIEMVHFQFFDVEIASHQRVVQIKLNGVIMIQSNYDGSDPSFHNEKYHLVIPPRTEVEFLGNINGSVVAMYATMTGRVYGAK